MKDLGKDRLTALALDAHEVARRFGALAPADPGARGAEFVATVFREVLRALLMREVVRAEAEAVAELLAGPDDADDPEAPQ